MRRVAITGVGIVSSLGLSREDVTASLRAGRSGVESVPTRKEMGFRSSLSGTLKGFTCPEIPKKNLRNMGQGSYLVVHAARQALAEAGLQEGHVKSDGTGITIGNMGNMKDTFDQCLTVQQGKQKLGGSALQRVMASSVSANLAVLLGTRGQVLEVSTACASGASAIGHSAQLIRYGHQDVMLAGGVEEGTWESACHFDALRAFSVREDDPTRASRPFDKQRDGLVPSCGAGIVVLEEYEHARKRGATIHAEIVGFGTNSDGYDMTIPSGTGSVRCMELALKDAGLRPEAVDYVNAHATSTAVGDATEAKSIGAVFGNRPLVSSTKSMTGHELGAAGSNELIYTLLMMRAGFVAPSINIGELDEACAGINVVANEAREVPIRVAASNSFGFGGVNACLILQRADA
jgi:3-oxoacyl-[acyl-carrier-protein] synthase-1